MNFIRNRLLNEELYFKVIVAFTVTGSGLGIYEGLKESRLYTAKYPTDIPETIIKSTLCGITGAGCGFVVGATSPLWIPIAITSTGFYCSSYIYNKIV